MLKDVCSDNTSLAGTLTFGLFARFGVLILKAELLPRKCHRGKTSLCGCGAQNQSLLLSEIKWTRSNSILCLKSECIFIKQILSRFSSFLLLAAYQSCGLSKHSPLLQSHLLAPWFLNIVCMCVYKVGCFCKTESLKTKFSEDLQPSIKLHKDVMRILLSS